MEQQYGELSEYNIKQAIDASFIKFDYTITDRYAEIKYRSIDSEVCMMIVSGLIFCGFRHLDICAGNIRAYFDKNIALIIHWSR